MIAAWYDRQGPPAEVLQVGELRSCQHPPLPSAAWQVTRPAAIAAGLLARTRAELPVLAGLGEREELLAAAWLASLHAPHTRQWNRR